MFIKKIFIMFFLFFINQIAGADEACKSELSGYMVLKSLQHSFLWDMPQQKQIVRIWTLNNISPKSRADETFAHALSIEEEDQCRGILKGYELPDKGSYFPSGENLDVEVFTLKENRNFILVKSSFFRSSETEDSHLVYYGGGPIRSSMKHVWQDMTRSVSPAGDELKLSLKPDVAIDLNIVLFDELDSKAVGRWKWNLESRAFEKIIN